MKFRSGAATCYLVTIFCIAAVLVWVRYQEDKSEIYFSSNRPVPIALSIQSPAEFAEESDFNCLNVTLQDTKFPMCLYLEHEDIYVSKSFLLGGYFESGWALNFVKILKDHQDFTFIDIGANLGTYSLPVGHLGRQVIAIEPNWNTMRRLAKSVYLGDLAQKIDLLYNAIGNRRSTTQLKLDRSNRGHTVLMNNVTCIDNCENSNISVSVVTLDDVIPVMKNKKAVMKVDTEGTEIDIFTTSSASEFFRVIDVVLIQMEWVFYLNIHAKSPEKRPLVDNFVHFFIQRNYSVYNVNSGQNLGSDWTTWPSDVCFKKSSAQGELFSL